jgi:sugar phosphate isomerase/epimerase
MPFGMPTLIELKLLESCAALCRELALGFVELNMNLLEYQTNKLNASHFLEIAEKYGIYYTIHLEENLNPCDFNNKVASAYTETVLQTIEVAKQLSVPVLNMHLHSGVWFTLPNKKIFLFDEYEQEYICKLTAFRDSCATAVGDSDMKICVENCGDYGDKPFLRKGLALLLESPAFALTYDVGHSAASDYVDEPTIMRYIENLYHIHIHDSSGRKSHLKLGDGDVDIAKYLDLVKKHDCRAVLEVKTVDGLRQSVDWLKAGGYI